ncbi:MAG: hypothetical protein EZS28_023444, partial [Streblomastix strix]
MEQQDVSEQGHIVRSILVEEQDRIDQTDQSNSIAITSHLNNGRFSGLMGATLEINSSKQEIWFQGDWNNHWRLTSSNQRETAAVLCGLLRSAPFLREQQVQSLKVETDDSSTAYNLNKGAAAISLLKLTDRILEVAEDLELQIHAFHIHGKESTIPDSLSRITTSDDYSLNEEILQQKVQEVCQPVAGQMGGSPGLSVDIMATRGTVSTPTYPSDTANSKQANGRLDISFDDPPILTITTVVTCTHEDDIKTDYPKRKRRRLIP